MTAPGGAPPFDRRFGAGILLGSLCLLCTELVLVRIFSVLMSYHFVSLILSLALFGITAGGLAVYLAPGRFPAERTGAQLERATLLLGAALLALWAFFFALSRRPLLAYRLLAPFHQPFFEPFGPRPAAPGLLSAEQALPLAVLYLLAALPFLCGGFAVTIALTRWAHRAALVYGWDLAGAGLGACGAFALLTALDPFSALAALAAVAAVGALCIPTGAPARRRAPAVLLAAVGAGLAAWSAAGDLVELKFVRGRYQPDLKLALWDATSRVAVFPLRGGQAEGSFGMSRTFRGEVPEQLGLVVDDTGYTTMARHRPGDDLAWARANLLSLPYRLRESPSALIIGPGGGKDILIARAAGAGAIRAVEVNPLVVRAVQQEFAEFSGRPYTLPGVEGIVDEGRTFLRRDARRYDVIQATVVYGNLAPSAGAFTFTEDHLYTTEAFHDYFDRLAPGGVLAISRFVHERRIQRLVATARAALEERGAAAPAAQVFIASERGLATVLAKLSPFTVGEAAFLERACRELGFEVLYSPLRQGAGPFYDLLRAADAAAYAETLAYDITPVDDDRPFFHYLLRPRDFFRAGWGGASPDFDDRALVLVRSLLAVAAVAVLAFLILPLLARGRAASIRWVEAAPALLYFSALGLGFIVTEIVLLKRFLLLLGKPVYTLAVVLSVFLVAGGAGSLRAGVFAGSRTSLRRRCAALSIVLLLTATTLPLLVEAALAAPLAARLLLAVAVSAPLGYLMGQPLPLGLYLVRQREGRLVPWVWGLNGALSVLGAVATLVLAVSFGYTTTMIVGTACYLVAGALADVV